METDGCRFAIGAEGRGQVVAGDPRFDEFGAHGRVHFGGDEVGFRQNGIARDGDQHRIGAQHGNGLADAQGIGIDLDVDA